MPHYEKLDISRIRAKVADIRESITILQNYAGYQEENFLNNQEAIRAARYTLIVAIEAATNIGNHFCSRLLGKAPNSYAETFLFLSEGGIISRELAIGLGKMTGLRNMLVHRYAIIDDRKILRFLRENLLDFEMFLSEISPYLQNCKKE